MNDAIRRSPQGELLTQLIIETFRLNGRLLTVGDRLTEPLGLSSALWQVLGAIDEKPLHMAQIARNMGLTRQSVRRTAMVLEKKGFVSFVENQDHKRAKLLALTQKGRTVLDQVNEIQMDWSNSLAKGFSTGDLTNAVRIMRELVEKLQPPGKGESS